MRQLHAFTSIGFRLACALLVTLTVTGCFTEPDYPDVPQIAFKGISRYTLAAGAGVGQQKRDSLVITIGFKDGDGDLGNNNPLDNLEKARFMQAGGWGNYKITTFRLENGQYKLFPSTENDFAFFPRLTREGKTGPIQGELDFRQIYQYGTSSKNYVIKYRIQIRDRALNVSNEIETDTITVPFLN